MSERENISSSSHNKIKSANKNILNQGIYENKYINNPFPRKMHNNNISYTNFNVISNDFSQVNKKHSQGMMNNPQIKINYS